MWPNQKQTDTAVLLKPKLNVCIGMFKKMFLNLTPTPKSAQKGEINCPKEPKKCRKAPNLAKLKNEKIGVYFQN